jgi:hypothetical protein
MSTLDSTPNPKSTCKPNLEPSDQNAQRPQTLHAQKEISMHMEKHKDCQLESATMDSRSSLQGAIGTAKTDPRLGLKVLFGFGMLSRVDTSA